MKTNKYLLGIVALLAAAMMLTTTVNGQVTCSKKMIGIAGRITTSREYVQVQDSIQQLAYALYKINEENPGYRYVHQTDEEGLIIAVSVIGISDTETAFVTAENLMRLEVLGESVRNMDPSLLPAEKDHNDGRISRSKSYHYKPSPPTRKETKKIISDAVPLITSADTQM